MKILGIVAVDAVREPRKFSMAPICRAHCAVIFAIAQLSCYQRVSIASYASAGIARGGMSVRLSVCLSVCHTPVLYQNEES